MHGEAASLLQRFRALLTRAERKAIDEIATVASAHGSGAYLVGGTVRDLLLGSSSLDVDITVEGDAPSIARTAARRAGLQPPRVYEAFRTSTLVVGERAIDVVTARSERYIHPGALPVVTPSTLTDDLARRDFTINAMAIRLSGADPGGLIDPHGGVADLERGLLRILHEQSFQDDATRLLRAARYVARFRFRLDAATARAAATSRWFLITISPARVRHEFQRIFAESDPARALTMVEHMGLSGELVTGLRYSRRVLAGYRRLTAPSPGPSPAGAGEGPGEGAVVCWLIPITLWRQDAISVYADRFDLTHGERRAAAALPETRRMLRRLVRHGAPDSAVVATLERLPEAALVAMACVSPESRSGRLARAYLSRLRHVRPRLTSNDLLAMGVQPGPLFGEVLRRLRAARLDTPSLTLDAEHALVQHVLDEHRGA